MADFTEEHKNSLAREAGSISRFIEKEIENYFPHQQANTVIQDDMRKQIDKAIRRLRDLYNQV